MIGTLGGSLLLIALFFGGLVVVLSLAVRMESTLVRPRRERVPVEAQDEAG